eukprot:444013_1
MEQLIIFRKGIDTLDSIEFDNCIRLFLTQCGASFCRDTQVNIVFKLLYQDLNENKMKNVNTMNDIIKTITSSRCIKSNENIDEDINNNTNSDEEYRNMKLDQLPEVIFHEISSYLHFSEALNFEKLNRTIFIGSRSSTRPIHSLNHFEFTKLVKYYHENDAVPKTRLFKSITINAEDVYDEDNSECLLHDFDQFAAELFENIESLTIQTEVGNLSNEFATVIHHLQFLTLSNIKTFRLFAECESLYEYDLQMIKLIMNNANNIEHFECNMWFNIEDAYTQDDFKFVSKLSGLCIRDEEYDSNAIDIRLIYSHMGPAMRSFHTNEITSTFSKLILSELCIWDFDFNVNNELDIKFLASADFTCLKRVYLGHCLNSRSTIEEEQTVELFMKKIIINVESICLRYYGRTLDILMKYFPLSMSNVLKLRINEVTLVMDSEINVFVGQLEKLINHLDMYYSDWMMIVYKVEIATAIPLECVIDMKGMSTSDYQFIVNDKVANLDSIDLKRRNNNDVLDKFLESQKMHCVQSEKLLNEERKIEEYCFVISKKGSCINGYDERWNMTCQHCKQSPVFK